MLDAAKSAADALRFFFPDWPGSFVGDARIDPDQLPLAWYTESSAGDALPGGRRIHTTKVYLRSAVTRDPDRAILGAAVEKMNDFLHDDQFAAAFGPRAAVVFDGSEYRISDKFHEIIFSMRVFARE